MTVLAALNLAISAAIHGLTLFLFGANSNLDAFFAGQMASNFVLSVFGVALGHVLVVFFLGSDRLTLNQKAWGVFIWSAIGSVALATPLLLTAKLWVPWMVPGFHPENLGLTVKMTQIQVWNLVFVLTGAVTLSAARARSKFLLAELAPLLTSLAFILVLLLLRSSLTLEMLAWFGVLRFALQMIALAPSLGPPTWPPLFHGAFERLRDSALPLVFGASVLKTEPLIHTFLLSHLAPGTLSLFFLAERVVRAFLSVVDRSSIVPWVPRIAALGTNSNRHVELMADRRKSILGFSSLFLAGFALLSFVLAWLGPDFGKIQPADFMAVGTLVSCMFGLLVGGAFYQLVLVYFATHNDTRSPVRSNVFIYVLALLPKWWATQILDGYGLALTVSMHYLAAALLSGTVLRKRCLERENAPEEGH